MDSAEGLLVYCNEVPSYYGYYNEKSTTDEIYDYENNKLLKQLVAVCSPQFYDSSKI